MLNCPAGCGDCRPASLLSSRRTHLRGEGAGLVISCGRAWSQAEVASQLQPRANFLGQGPRPESEKGATAGPPLYVSPWPSSHRLCCHHGRKGRPGEDSPRAPAMLPGRGASTMGANRRLNSLASSQEPRAHNSPLSAGSWGNTEPPPHPTPQGSSLTGEPS